METKKKPPVLATPTAPLNSVQCGLNNLQNSPYANESQLDETCYLGVDPGLSGAVAFYFPAYPERIAAYDVPVADKEIDAGAFARIVDRFCPAAAVIERVSAMPKQGVSSTFRFGQAYGTIRGVIQALGLPSHLVTPASWKKHFKLPSDKEKARALAVRLWPSSEHFERKMDHNRAEAALLARYGAETLIWGAR
jgi:hypothetical protein